MRLYFGDFYVGSVSLKASIWAFKDISDQAMITHAQEISIPMKIFIIIQEKFAKYIIRDFPEFRVINDLLKPNFKLLFQNKTVLAHSCEYCNQSQTPRTE